MRKGKMLPASDAQATLSYPKADGKKREKDLHKRWAGIILAGGESRRFGSPKAFAEYKGGYFYEQAVHAVAPHAEEILLVSHPALTDEFEAGGSVRVIEDEDAYKGKGPLAGIHSAMNKSQAEWYIVLPCDMPLIDSRTIGKLAAEADENFDAVVPRIEGRIQPLCALYRYTAFPSLKGQLSQGAYRMVDFLDTLKVKWLDEKQMGIEADCFQNINTQEALGQLAIPGRRGARRE